MLKLIKYELIKQKTSKIILAAFVILAELAFVIGVGIDNENVWAPAVFCLILLTMITFAIVALEAIITYYHDMQDKSGYMLFMTPHSVYTILGSKIIASIISIVVAAVIFGALAFLDVTWIAARYGELAYMAEAFQSIMHEMYSIEISWSFGFVGLVEGVFSWIGMLTSAFLAITLCMTLMGNVRGKGFISFIGFCIINWAYEFVAVQLSDWLQLSSLMAQMGLMAVMTVIFAGACFWAAGYILNRELSL